MKTATWIVLGAIGLWSCEGGSFKKKDCKTCETVTTGLQSQSTSITNQVCGDDEVAAHIVANTASNSSVTIVTTCK